MRGLQESRAYGTLPEGIYQAGTAARMERGRWHCTITAPTRPLTLQHFSEGVNLCGDATVNHNLVLTMENSSER